MREHIGFCAEKMNFARPQALTCQGRRRSAAAAHAKGPARPVVQSAFRAKGLWQKNLQIFKFLAINVALPEATPSRFLISSLNPPSLRSGSARSKNSLRATQHLILKINKRLICCAGRSAFGRRGTRRSQMARAWPRAAQH